MQFSWMLFGYVWVGGWAIMALSFSALMRVWAKDNETRSDTAYLRATWGDREGRARVAISLLLTWPFALIMWGLALLLAVGTWLLKRSEKKSEQDAEPVRE